MDSPGPACQAEGPLVSPTATVTATTAAANSLRQPSTANYSRTFDLTWASATPEKRTVGKFDPSPTTGLMAPHNHARPQTAEQPGQAATIPDTVYSSIQGLILDVMKILCSNKNPAQT